MQVKWLGHSCFLFTGKFGLRIITDPFRADSRLRYHQIDVPADIITISHDHYDHNYTDLIPGKYQVIRNSGEWTIKDVEIRSFDTWHDEVGGRERGSNIIFRINIDGITICHCGDLGHDLTSDQLKAVGSVDVLCIPVGGKYTLDLLKVNQICEAIEPKIILPMHYKTAQCAFLQNTVEDFIKDKKNTRIIDSGLIEMTEETLPSKTEIIVLKYKD